MYFLYDLLGIIIIIFSPFIILFRLIFGKEDPKRFLEKFCIYSKKFKKKKTIWIHGASVGEIISIIPILKKFEENKKIKKILITSSTTSSASIITKFKFKKVTHKYFPLDINYFTNKFLKYWNPHLAIFVESEIWPNMFKNLYKKQIPIILLNARITKKSFYNWKRFSNFAETVFNKISIAMPQNVETLKYLKILGVKKIKSCGNLKYFGENKSNKIKLNFKGKFKNKEIWCAASTHEKEELIIGKTHKKLKLIKKNLLTIIIPRHVNRLNSIINDLNKIGLKSIIHSSNEKIEKDTDIYLVDTYGEASKFYELSNLTFLGGSLIPHGGQNPLEPARLGNYIIHGPFVENFKEVYAMLGNLKISSKVNSVSSMQKIIKNKIRYKQSSSVNKRLFSTGKIILNKNLKEINNFIR